jgi:5'-deoxynucleotidase YfbR-like HD superfamily hydrolase
MHRMAMMAMSLPDGPIAIDDRPPCAFDRLKCVEMALVHDLAEATVGGKQAIKRLVKDCYSVRQYLGTT